MVVPWIGFSLSEILNKAGVQSGGKYVAFQTLNRPAEMPGICWNPRFPWTYVEGLRMDEAMHPLSMIATGMYGESLPNQTVRLCGWLYRGNMDLNPSNRS